MARALLNLSKGDVPVASLTLRRYEDETVADVEIPLLHTLIAWYEKSGIEFDAKDDCAPVVRRAGA